MAQKSRIKGFLVFMLVIFVLLTIVALFHDSLTYRLTSSREACLKQAKEKLGSKWDQPMDLTN